MTNYLYDQMYLMNLQVICQKIQKDIHTDIITFHPLVASIDNSIQVIHYLKKKRESVCSRVHVQLHIVLMTHKGFLLLFLITLMCSNAFSVDNTVM